MDVKRKKNKITKNVLKHVSLRCVVLFCPFQAEKPAYKYVESGSFSLDDIRHAAEAPFLSGLLKIDAVHGVDVMQCVS